jgi:hypothetical protein
MVVAQITSIFFKRMLNGRNGAVRPASIAVIPGVTHWRANPDGLLRQTELFRSSLRQEATLRAPRGFRAVFLVCVFLGAAVSTNIL